MLLLKVNTFILFWAFTLYLHNIYQTNNVMQSNDKVKGTCHNEAEYN